MAWWARFGLIREPNLDVFPLSVENAHLFVETRRSTELNAMLSRLEDPLLLLRKVYALIGEFGSGKTTVVAYTRYKFYMKQMNICSINLNWKLQPINGPHDIRNWFMQEIKKQLQWTFSEIAETSEIKTPSDSLITAGFEEEGILKALKNLGKHYSGIIIFLDELHREEEAL